MTLPVPVVAPAVANNVNTYASRSSYVTVQEFKDAPTAVELDNLVLNGSTASQDEALAVVIERASSWADALTYQTLAATVDTAYGRARVRSDGTVRFPLPFKPVIAVLGIAVGGRPSAMSPMGSLVDVVINQHGTIEFPAFGVASNGYGYGLSGFGVASQPLVQVTYVNGYPNTTAAGATTAGLTTLPVVSVLGVFPGTTLTVYDGPSTETVTVLATSPGSLTLAAPLRFAHAPGVSVSALPPKVKQAVILLAASLIQTAGTDAIVLQQMAEPGGLVSEKGASAENIALAMDMLDEFKRVW
jgi:hypothetical protein